MGKISLLLGGARSGKSSYAEKLAAECQGQVLYIATAQALDDEMERRIQLHKKDRPADWETREISDNIAEYIKKERLRADLFLLDCITMLVSNLVLAHCQSIEEPDEIAAEIAVNKEINSLIEVMENSEANWVLVSNDVGLGLVPPNPLGRLYRDLLGRVNRNLARSSNEVFWITAGIAVPLHDLGFTIE